jgi:Na+/H+ antiporter NhaD/arsenite permease-like protein
MIELLLKEWLVVLSSLGLLFSSLYLQSFPIFSLSEFQVLFLLFSLFIVVKGLQNSGFILRLAHFLERGKMIPLKLVLSTFFLSMVVTNDIALVVLVPLTLSLNITRKDILVILEVISANAGSALTPVGNPQNLFIYWYYDVDVSSFLETIAPFSLFFLFLIVLGASFLEVKSISKKESIETFNKKAYIYLLFLFLVLMVVLHILPIILLGIIFLFLLYYDRKSFKIDYSILIVFALFFAIANNLKIILASDLEEFNHLFLMASMSSQVMSNVPTTLLLAKFTSDWQTLLWGVNAGGFGSLFASFSNLIAYRLYIVHQKKINKLVFTLKFLIFNYLALLLAIGFYYLYPYIVMKLSDFVKLLFLLL